MITYVITNKQKKNTSIKDFFIYRLALDASEQYHPRLQRNAAVVLCSLCTSNRAAMLAVPDATFIKIVKKLLKYLKDKYK